MIRIVSGLISGAQMWAANVVLKCIYSDLSQKVPVVIRSGNARQRCNSLTEKPHRRAPPRRCWPAHRCRCRTASGSGSFPCRGGLPSHGGTASSPWEETRETLRLQPRTDRGGWDFDRNFFFFHPKNFSEHAHQLKAPHQSPHILKKKKGSSKGRYRCNYCQWG